MKPNVSLIVSGGHTMLVVVRGLADYQFIGHTVEMLQARHSTK